MNIVRSALGHYEITGNPDEADLVIGQSFGTLTSEGSVNRSLAEFIAEHAGGRPIVADETLADAFTPDMPKVAKVIKGPRINAIGQGMGAWAVLLGAKQFMEGKGLHLPLMAAQAHHIGRVAMQAKKLEMPYVLPGNLPSHFEPNSEQWQTRSLGAWITWEVLGSVKLRSQGKL